MCNNHRRSGAEDMYYNKITLHGPRQGFVLSLVKPKHTHTIQTDSGIVSIYVGPVWNARMKNTWIEENTDTEIEKQSIEKYKNK